MNPLDLPNVPPLTREQARALDDLLDRLQAAWDAVQLDPRADAWAKERAYGIATGLAKARQIVRAPVVENEAAHLIDVAGHFLDRTAPKEA